MEFTNYTDWKERGFDMPLSGGRGQECIECPVEGDVGFSESCTKHEEGCVCRAVGEICLTDFKFIYSPFLFDMFLVIMVIVNACIFYRTVIFAKQAVVTHKPGKAYSPMDKIMFLAVFGTGLRFLWYFTITNGRREGNLLLGYAMDSVLVKIPQICWQSAYLYLALVWKKLLDQLETMKKNSAEEQAALEKKVNFTTFFLMCVLIPMQVASTVVPILESLVSLFQVVGGVFLIYKASKFGASLSEKIGEIESAKSLVKAIKRTIRLATVGASMLFTVVFVNFYATGKWGYMWTLVFWWGVHAGECFMAYALLVTKVYQERKESKKVVPQGQAETDVSNTSKASSASAVEQ